MKRSWLIIWIFVLIAIIVIGFYLYPISKNDIDSKTQNPNSDNINKEFRCEVNSDCIVFQAMCLSGACWNKDNVPGTPVLPPNAGVCAPFSEVTNCVCEKNRCQPITSERDAGNINIQSCNSNDNCFNDEICLDSNYVWNGEVLIKSYNGAIDKSCFLKCDTDIDCPSYLECQSANLVSYEAKGVLAGTNTEDWQDNEDLKKSDVIKYCEIKGYFK